jgi:hypothetical protein
MNRDTVPLTIRLPRRLYDWLREDARRLRRSISSQAVYLLERESLEAEKDEPYGADARRDPPGH